MPKFMIEETLTSNAYAGMLQRPEDRGEVLKPIFEAAGCKLEQAQDCRVFFSLVVSDSDNWFSSCSNSADFFKDSIKLN